MSLCPGYRQVIQFVPDDDYEEEGKEIIYITLELWFGRSERDVDGYGTAVLWYNTETQYPTWKAHPSLSASEKSKVKAKAKADAYRLVLDRITSKLAPLPRRRRTRKMEVIPEDY
ncbi:hypothetical protein EDD18DRAFT_1100971 [Armillaria luteobubalina]|uniref:Uncharacterized protein n=1 Tax=Armillaria luteobubalina TaxID=153913 RepID=A0AA39V262_9AGAR|nr:hypothetical protein EDD18DRAFT_1100971 [Armillaria luteobubalina]